MSACRFPGSLKRLLPLLCATLLMACANTRPVDTPFFKPLPDAARSQIRHVEVLAGVGQNGLLIGDKNVIWQPAKTQSDLVTVPAPRVGERFGDADSYGWAVVPSARLHEKNDALVMLGVLLLVGAVVMVQAAGEKGYDSYRYYMADRALAPIRRNLADYDFGERLRESLDKNGRAVTAVRDGKVELVMPATPQHFESRYAMAQGDAVLVVTVNYAMSMDLNTLTVAAEANLFPKSDELWQRQYDAYRRGTRMDQLPGVLRTDVRHSLYRNVISYGVSLPGKEEDRDAAASLWAADEGARVRGALNEGLSVISRVIAQDLSREATAPLDTVVDDNGKRFTVLRDTRGVTTVTRRF